MSETVQLLNALTRWANYLIAVPILIFGISGALLTVLVFTRHRTFRKTPAIAYLAAGATMTAIHLPSIYLIAVLVEGFGLRIFTSSDIACRMYNYFLYVTTVSAISYPCWAAFDQFAGTSRSAAFRHRWNSMRVTRIAIVGTFILWSLIYLPIFFVSSLTNNICRMTNASYTKFNNYVLTPLVFTVMPLVTILVFMRGTIQNLRNTSLPHRHDRFTRQIRRMLVPQLLILGVSGFPFGLESVYREATSQMPKDDLQLAIERLTFNCFRLFYHLNFVCTFYIYLYMSSEVRLAVKRLSDICSRNRTETLNLSINDPKGTLQTMKSNNPIS